jgi:Double zinc ribbon
MSGFREELRIIPRGAWITGGILYAGLVVGVSCAIRYGGDPEISAWPFLPKALLAGGPPLLLLAFVALIGYVNGDAKRRGMRHVMWTLLAIFVPYTIGIIMYFILRDPLPRVCPVDGRMVPAKFTFCPHCGTALKRTCPHCGKAVEPTWSNCASCGTRLPSQTSDAA